MVSRLQWPAALVAAQVILGVVPASAQSGLSGDTIKVTRATGAITVDGDLSDEGWRGATGEDIDFANARRGTGTTINLQATLNPTEHLDVARVQNQ
jgi:hypothetical protein